MRKACFRRVFVGLAGLFVVLALLFTGWRTSDDGLRAGLGIASVLLGAIVGRVVSRRRTDPPLPEITSEHLTVGSFLSKQSYLYRTPTHLCIVYLRRGGARHAVWIALDKLRGIWIEKSLKNAPFFGIQIVGVNHIYRLYTQKENSQIANAFFHDLPVHSYTHTRGGRRVYTPWEMALTKRVRPYRRTSTVLTVVGLVAFCWALFFAPTGDSAPLLALCVPPVYFLVWCHRCDWALLQHLPGEEVYNAFDCVPWLFPCFALGYWALMLDLAYPIQVIFPAACIAVAAIGITLLCKASRDLSLRRFLVAILCVSLLYAPGAVVYLNKLTATPKTQQSVQVVEKRVVSSRSGTTYSLVLNVGEPTDRQLVDKQTYLDAAVGDTVQLHTYRGALGIEYTFVTAG